MGSFDGEGGSFLLVEGWRKMVVMDHNMMKERRAARIVRGFSRVSSIVAAVGESELCLERGVFFSRDCLWFYICLTCNGKSKLITL